MTDETPTTWPVKIRDMHTHQLKSTRWDDFKFRDDDIIIATYAKSGTTWTQQIVAQLLFNGAEEINTSRMSPWVEHRILPEEVIAALEQQIHRRFMKTHLPVDALVFSPKAKYIHVGRDGRDAAWSFHNHQFNAKDELFIRINAGMPEGTRPWERGSADPLDFYRLWLAENGYPLWPFWDHVRSWWSIRDLPNVLQIHFNHLKSDTETSIRKIADFLAIEIDEANWSRIVEHCSFDWMKKNASSIAPFGGMMWQGGGQTFINKGTNGRWRDALSPGEVAAYEARALAELGPECARWLATGEKLSD